MDGHDICPTIHCGAKENCEKRVPHIVEVCDAEVKLFDVGIRPKVSYTYVCYKLLRLILKLQVLLVTRATERALRTRAIAAA